MVQRHIAKITLSEALQDIEFDKLSSDPKVTITAMQDELTKDGQSIRVIDYIEKVVDPVYIIPVN